MIVVDTNILSYLARAGCLTEFLAAFTGQIASTPLVRAEVERALAAGHAVLTAALETPVKKAGLTPIIGQTS